MRKRHPVPPVDDGSTFEGPVRPGGAAVVPARVDPLAEQFLDRTRCDIARLRSLARCARTDGRIDLEQIGRIAHSINGAAAMFGFPAVSASGGAIERRVESLVMRREPDEGAIEPPEDCLDELIERLARVLEAGHASE